MAPTTKYTDFEEGEPFTRHDRRYVPIKCKRCERVFDLAEASLRSNKSSRCKRHLDSECTAEETKRQRLATQEAPADPPLVLDTSANEERARKLERDVEVLKEGQRRHQGYFDQAAQLLSLAIPCHPPAMIQEIQSRNVLMAPRADYEGKIEALQTTVDEQREKWQSTLDKERDKYEGKIVKWESTLEKERETQESKIALLQSTLESKIALLQSTLEKERETQESRVAKLQETVDKEREAHLVKVFDMESKIERERERYEVKIAELESKVTNEQTRSAKYTDIADEERAKRLKLADENERLTGELHRAQEEVKQTNAAMVTNKEELDAFIQRYTAAEERAQAADVKVANARRKATEDIKTAQSSISAIEEKYKATLAQNQMLGDKCLRLAKDAEYRKQFLGKIPSTAHHEFKTSHRVRPGTPTSNDPSPPSPRPCASPRPKPNTGGRR